jgi:ABC-type uncharacterized transport system substrate-binding protein
MRYSRLALIIAFGGLMAAGGTASAHPHVWVTMKSSLVYAPDGSITGIRHAWTFDEMFSTFAVQGLGDIKPDTPAQAQQTSPPATKQPSGGFGQWVSSAVGWLQGLFGGGTQSDTGATQTPPASPQAPTAPAPKASDVPGALTREQLQPLAKVNIESLKEFDYFTFAKASGGKAAFVDPIDYWLEFKDSTLTLHFTLPFQSAVKTTALDIEIYDPSYFVDFAFAEKDAVALSGAPSQCKFALRGRGDPAAVDPRQLGESFFQQLDSSNYGAQFANKIAVRCQ